ncbi:hypothetical protein AAG906_033685 [Vitis piasezkii]
MGKESVKLVLDGVNHVVAEVYYIPKLRNNLLKMCKIFHPNKGLIIQTNMSANRMFILLTQNLFHLWHRRYGHLSYKGLKTLLYKNMVCGLPQFSTSSVTCTNCINGKQYPTHKLELIHADICGPITPTSNRNKSGIKRRLTIAYTPQQNDVTKRKNRTVMNMVQERRIKLDNRSITCVQLGVSKESKGYKLFDPVAKRVVVIDLEWGDGENEEGVSENGNRKNIDGEVRETRDKGYGFSEGEERVKELRQSRDRQPPTWMGDYISGEGLFEDEVHMTSVESTDPLYFEEAVKSANLRLGMNSEIKSIGKNQTWTLTEMPPGPKE